MIDPKQVQGLANAVFLRVAATILTTGNGSSPADISLDDSSQPDGMTVAFVPDPDDVTPWCIQVNFPPAPWPGLTGVYPIVGTFTSASSDYQVGSLFVIPDGRAPRSATFRVTNGSFFDPSTVAMEIALFIAAKS
jgi:hypothetical protein